MKLLYCELMQLLHTVFEQSKGCLNKLDDSSATAGPCLTGSSSAASLNNLIRHVSLSAFPLYAFVPCWC